MKKGKILIVADSFKHFNQCIEDFTKRFGKNIEIIKIKPTKGNSVDDIIRKDTQKIIDLLKKDKNYKILLSKDGKNISTEDLVKMVQTNLNLTFIIGGPYGLDEDRLSNFINTKISFGNITMSHLVVLIVLLEQLFRVKTILEGRKYHY